MLTSEKYENLKEIHVKTDEKFKIDNLFSVSMCEILNLKLYTTYN